MLFFFGGGLGFLFFVLLQADLRLLEAWLDIFLQGSVYAPQADSWWLGHVETDDVVIADIGGQSLDIFLHGPEWHSKDIHSHIHSHTPMHTPQKTNKKKAKKKLNSPNIMPSFTDPLPVQCGRGRRSESLADAPQHCFTWEAFSQKY